MKRSKLWAPVIGYEKYYEVSRTGKVRNIKTKRVLKTQINRGYECLNLCKNGKYQYKRVHRLVIAAFFKQSEMEVNHVDGNKRNNHINNLEYCTRSENMKHAFYCGLHNLSGINHNRSKFTNKELAKVKAYIKEGISNKNIAMLYGVDPSIISHIKRGATYKKK